MGRAERFTALSPSFYGWAAATVLGKHASRRFAPDEHMRLPARLLLCVFCSSVVARNDTGTQEHSARLVHCSMTPLLMLAVLPSTPFAGYAFTVQLAKVLYIRRFRGWL